VNCIHINRVIPGNACVAVFVDASSML